MTRFIYEQFSEDYCETLFSGHEFLGVAKFVDGYFVPNSLELPIELGLSVFGGTSSVEWEKGIYFLAAYLLTAIIVIHQLPLTPDTLWLRLLSK